MTPEQLKASILQYAIQGKLVEQRAEEGTAEELYQQIQEDKRIRLNGKKEAKLAPEIFKENEIPFDIPDNWKWVRFGHIMVNRDAERIPLSVSEREQLEKTYDYYGASGVIDKVDKYIFDKTLLLIGEDGANLLSRSTPIAFLAKGKYWVNNHAHVLDCNSDFLYMEYVMYFINAISLAPYVTGTAQPKMNQEKMNSIPVALPPLEEQHRIVAKIEELLPFVDRYAEAYAKLEKFNAKFPEDMKKSILQYAIQGKLVEQRAEEGTAEELWGEVQEERKIYKLKNFEVESVEEPPFDIPDTWKWIHLQDIVKKTIKRGKSPKYVEKSDVQVFAQKCNVKTGGINMNLALFLDDSVIEKYPAEEFMCNGDIVINSTGGGTMGRVGIFHDTDRVDNMRIVPDGHVTVIRACDSIDYKYLYYFIKHNQKYLETQGEGSTNQTELKPITIASLILPLPPLEEQKRIVAKIEELLPYCDRLKNR